MYRFFPPLTKIKFIAVCVAWFSLAAPSAHAWSQAGHMMAARIAFQQLSPGARRAASDILAAHPEMGQWRKYVRFAPPGEEDCFLFMRASTWPDEINRPPGVSPYAHPAWHYIDYPLQPPGFPFIAGRELEDNVLFGLAQSSKTLRDPAATPEARAAALSWVIHLVADLHQPLHCAELVTKDYPLPQGDRGGNLFFISVGGQAMNLHSFWDRLPGQATHPDQAFAPAAELARRYPAASLPELQTAKDTAAWTLEGRTLAIEKAYERGTLPGTADRNAQPPPLPDGYVGRSREVAERRIALAGYRLGRLLEELLTQR